MTIDEAISHAEEVAEDNETKARRIGQQYEGTLLDRDAKECRRCAAEHRQLAEWLTDYKELREICSAQTEVIGFFESDNKQLDEHLKEAKRLLKAAVEDFTAIAEVHAAATPILCPQYGKYMKAIDVRTRKWRYADIASKLIGETNDEP